MGNVKEAVQVGANKLMRIAVVLMREHDNWKYYWIEIRSYRRLKYPEEERHDEGRLIKILVRVLQCRGHIFSPLQPP